MMSTFTVIDICRALGYEPVPPLIWQIGAAVRDDYAGIVGALPMKGLRQKTSGLGSHCFALYPPEYRPRAASLIRAMLVDAHAAAIAQLHLFD